MSTSITIQLSDSIPSLALARSQGAFDIGPPQILEPGSTITFTGPPDGSVTYTSRASLVTLTISFVTTGTANTANVTLSAEGFSVGDFTVDWFGAAVNDESWLPFAVPQFGSPVYLYAGVRMLTEPPMQPASGQIL